MGLADNFFHSGMLPFNIVVGSGLVLIEAVPMEWWKVSIDPGGREVVNQLINSWDVGGVLLDGKPSCSNICQWDRMPLKPSLVRMPSRVVLILTLIHLQVSLLKFMQI